MLDTIQSYDYLINRINITTRNLKAHRVILDKEEHKYLYPVYEKAMYLCIALADLMVGLKYLDVSNAVKNEYEANYFARGVAAICYELINHQEKIIGEKIYKTVTENIGSDSLSEIVTSKKRLRRITKEHFQILKHIRNNLYAHRNDNGYEMAVEMLKIKNVNLYETGKSIFDIYFKILHNYVHLITQFQ